MKMKSWGYALLLALGMMGAFYAPRTQADPIDRPGSYWRHHDGHWSYWHDGDRRWYYTDGTNWYYNDEGAWKFYRFDGKFGKEGFERGEYKAPEQGIEIQTPRHRIFIPR